MLEAKRNYKDSMFRKLFNDKEKLIELYNALSGSNYPPDTKVEIVTLDEAIFDDFKNDLSFIIDDKFIVLAEQQSTVNPNMPVRMHAGFEKGKKEGRQEGKKEGIRLVAEKMKYEGMSAFKIAELTGLSLEEVEAIDTSDSK